MSIQGLVAGNNRVQWVDSAKGLCIIFVVVSHFGVNGHLLGPFYQYFFLPLFFFLSGFVYKETDSISFIKRLARGLLVPLMCFTIIYHVATISFFCSLFNGLLWESFKTIINDIVFGVSFWFINCLIIIQILWNFISRFILKLSIPWHILFSLGMISALFIINQNWGGHFPWNIDTAIWSTGYFSIGAAFKRIYVRKQELHIKSNIIRFLSILFFIAYIITAYSTYSIEGACDIHYNDFGDLPVLFFLLSIAGTGSVLLLFRVFNVVGFFSLLGQHTLVVYFLQGHAYLVIEKFINTFRLSYLIDSFPNLFTIMIAFIVCFICTSISILLNRYIPFLVGKKGKQINNG